MKKKIGLALLLPFAITAALFSLPQVYFSPNGKIQDRIADQIDACVDSIDVMCYDFTSKKLAKSLVGARERGVRVRVLLDKSKTEEPKSMCRTLKTGQVDVKKISAPRDGIMHNKVAIFDSKLVFTGSYNWTTGAEHYNYENAVFLEDNELIFEFQKQFNDLWEKGKD